MNKMAVLLLLNIYYILHIVHVIRMDTFKDLMYLTLGPIGYCYYHGTLERGD